ncbi:PLP-dependent aminotransferase family protein [Chitinibacter fontanus]|uniref:Putative 8-amino-7-oxononanoate synthase n=1 Tax=Chitinibacter fontanus TaxID=1737446 RepID=A0A7D5VA94_9NEIS|nr:PLP-dependent aminotransferase family protein [Chitinibacter fontanus]QLI81253.1 PLP-dependent aminotransferase family protein [Chitinibacter fontanus]
MSAIPTLFASHAQANLPLHEQLVRTLRHAIVDGHLALASRLPATRTLAADLQLSRSTVELAYARLESEGYVQRKVGAGSFVAIAGQRQSAAQRKAAAGLSQRGQAIADMGACRDSANAVSNGLFFTGQPDSCAFPRELWGRLMQQRWKKDGEKLMRYGDPQGLPELRAAIASYLAQSRNVVCDASQIVILSSSQQAIQLTAQLLIDTGDTVWLEDPGYLGARNAMQSAGAAICPIPVDAEGMQINEHTGTKYPKPKLIYTTPSHQYPLGVAMSLTRRMALLEQAAAMKAWIIEDDYDGEFQYEQRPLPSLQGLDTQGRVIYMGTFSKVLFGSLRLAYLVLPPELVAPFTLARTAFDGHSNQLMQAVTADFIHGGHFASHLRQMRTLYKSRRDLLMAQLAEHCPQLTPINTSGGLQFAVWCPAGCEAKWATAGIAQGLPMRPLSKFYLGEQQGEGFLMGYSSLNNDEIRLQAYTLGNIINQRASTPLTAARNTPK